MELGKKKRRVSELRYYSSVQFDVTVSKNCYNKDLIAVTIIPFSVIVNPWILQYLDFESSTYYLVA